VWTVSYFLSLFQKMLSRGFSGNSVIFFVS